MKALMMKHRFIDDVAEFLEAYKCSNMQRMQIKEEICRR